MLDFYQIKEREGVRKGTLEVYPDFRVGRSKDLMVRGKAFYAIWDEKTGLWSTDEYDVQRLVDEELEAHQQYTLGHYEVHKKYLGNFSTNSWLQFRNYVGHVSDSSTQLDESLTFANQEVKKSDYVSRRLPYSLAEGSIEAWDAIMSVLYDPVERAKIEWAIGAIVSGDSKKIQKFLVFYGAAGTGKSTVLNIIEKMFQGYVANFNAKAMTGGNNQFSTDVFRLNPLVLIEQDGDLSKIEDNSKFNSIISHEMMTMSEKYKTSYDARSNAFPLIGTNKPVKIPDAKSGLIRRLIDVHPTGDIIPARKYQTLISQVDFELGAIAYHCLQVYRDMGKHYYDAYRPTEMMLQTDIFYNFIEANYDIFAHQDGITLKQAFTMYLEFIKETGVEYKLPQYKFREELRNYFDHFEARKELPDGSRVSSWYSGFTADKFKVQVKDDMVFSLALEETVSLLDERYKDLPAQYSKPDGTPRKFWTNAPKTDKNGKEFTPKPEQVVDTVLSDINTSKEHYTRTLPQDIVIDFDIADENGKKSLQKNLEAASQWPHTYAELSKSEHGVHLTYEYEGDVSELSRVFEPGVEIKVFTGDSTLRRRLTKCNNVPVAKLAVGSLPIKEKKVISGDSVKTERSLREQVERNLRKEIHAGTKPSIDFIVKILDDAYKSGLHYDLTNMRPKILNFAMGSTNQKMYCIKQVQNMKFKSEVSDEPLEEPAEYDPNEVGKVSLEDDSDIVFFDIEVFPNLIVICWKARGKGKTVVRMINPTPQAVEEIVTKMKLVGFNVRKYDNHILYALMMGWDIPRVYQLSQKLVSNSPNATFGEAYNISYTDIYDFASAGNKKSLKRWQIDLGLKHQELGLPWDQPVPEELWDKVADYCANDVETEEDVFDHLSGDWLARKILAQLSGLSVNETTNKHSIKIMFGNERRPQAEFKYTNLAEMFPGYEFNFGKSTYRGEEVGEGGLVRSKPGIYTDVAVLDVASMHPTSIEQLELFGSYTKTFSEIKNARVAIKRGNLEDAKLMLGGKLAPFLEDKDSLGGLSDALKTVINSVYGLTSASFENPFRDPRNIDNIVAKRGALFMLELMNAVEELGYTVIHIKTDSIKIPNADKAVIEFVMEFGEKYGYEFEHEATYKKMALVNDAVYIAYVEEGRKPAHWEAVGTQFQHPFVFKTLFSHEPIKFADKCETKQVTTALYLDFDQDEEAMALAKLPGKVFVGKSGSFCPIQEGKGGGTLLREKDGKFYAATGSTGFKWLEAEMVSTLGKEKDIDLAYFRKLVDKSVENISQYLEGSPFNTFEEFAS